MTFEEKLAAAIEKEIASDIRRCTGLELDPDSIGWCKYWANWARQETLREMMDMVGVYYDKNFIGLHAYNTFITELKLEAEREG